MPDFLPSTAQLPYPRLSSLPGSNAARVEVVKLFFDHIGDVSHQPLAAMALVVNVSLGVGHPGLLALGVWQPFLKITPPTHHPSG